MMEIWHNDGCVSRVGANVGEVLADLSTPQRCDKALIQYTILALWNHTHKTKNKLILLRTLKEKKGRKFGVFINSRVKNSYNLQGDFIRVLQLALRPE